MLNFIKVLLIIGFASATTSNYSVFNPFIYKVGENRHKSFHWILTDGSCQPDNYVQECYLINGQFPGPPVIVHQYDFVEITVVNRLSIPTSIHFHGLLQRHTVDADGVPFVTQDLIQPGGTYVYRIQIDGQTGTYMYHGHHELDIVWLHGPFIILDNPAFYSELGPEYQYEAGYEHIFQLESIFHKSLDGILADIRVNGTDDPAISSLAINGLSYGQWPERNGHAPGYEVFRVQPGKKYRCRVINISMGSLFRFEIQGHSMTVVEVDGITVKPWATDHLEINTGQRYSIIVAMTSPPDNYWISSSLLSGNEGPSNGKAILHYATASSPVPLRTQLFLETTPAMDPNPVWTQNLHPNPNYTDPATPPFPLSPTETIFIDMYYRLTDGPPRFLINGHALSPPNGTYLKRVRAGEDITINDPHVFPIQEGAVIDMIFQNRIDDTLGCDSHPIHLHGHTFWVLQSGPNTVDLEALPSILESVSQNGSSILYRDTFTLFPDQSPENLTSGAGCGWSVIRFVADNPGLWLVHCHVTSHMVLGKMFTMYEYDEYNPQLINE